MTRPEAEAVLWHETFTCLASPIRPERRRVDATRCPKCGGWVEVRLQPVRLRCVGCGLKARP